LSSDAGHESHPYLSVVATARNDDHGGRLLHRLQLFVDGLAAQCDRHGIDAELILVEWNPPDDKPHLGEVIVWPESRRCSFRLIEVPPHVHARLEHSERLPLFQMIAKNVGIRRASGEWILATNVDVLFSDPLMGHLARGELDPTAVYRVDRYDVEDVFELGEPIDDQLRAASQNVIRICRRDATVDLRSGEINRHYDRYALLAAKLPDMLTSLSLDIRGALRKAQFVTRRIRAWLRGRGSAPDKKTQLQQSPAARVHASSRRRMHNAHVRTHARLHMHTNACGDFTLLTREAWDRLRGYPELQIFSMHLDSLLLFQAHAAGYREHVLSEPLYHIEHSSGFTPETWRELDARISAASIRQLTWSEVLEWASEMNDQGGPLDFNDDDWGFADTEFLEYRPTTAHVA